MDNTTPPVPGTDGTDGTDGTAPVRATRYSAPALQKGLRLLAFLAGKDEPLTLTEIAHQTGRSSGEVFRLLQVLLADGFVAQGRDGYVLTTRLLQMGMERPPVRNLVEIALPVMRRLAMECGQSCHLVFATEGEIVVVARMESRERMGFSVRVGYRQPLHLTGSGKVLYAFQPPEIRAEWEGMFSPRPSASQLEEFRAQVGAIRRDGIALSESAFVHGVTDLAAPILRGEQAAAALAIPFIRRRAGGMAVEDTLDRLRAATAEISGELTVHDGRA